MRPVGSDGEPARTGASASRSADGRGSHRPRSTPAYGRRHDDHRACLRLVAPRIGRDGGRSPPIHPMVAMRPAATLASIRPRASGSGEASVTPTRSSPCRWARSTRRSRFIGPLSLVEHPPDVVLGLGADPPPVRSGSRTVPAPYERSSTTSRPRPRARDECRPAPPGRLTALASRAGAPTRAGPPGGDLRASRAVGARTGEPPPRWLVRGR